MLLYAWFDKIGRETSQLKCEGGIVFIKRFHIRYLPSEHTLVMEKNEKYIPHFFGKNIEDITALVGENGAGKTQLSKHLLKILQGSISRESAILVFLSGRQIYVQCGKNQIQTVRFGQHEISFQDKKQEPAGGYTVAMGIPDAAAQVVPLMATNAFAPGELNELMDSMNHCYRSPAYNLHYAYQWEQVRYGVQVGSFLHKNASAYASAKLNSPLEEYGVYQARLIIACYLTAKDTPIIKKMKIYQRFHMGIRAFEGRIFMENTDKGLREECEFIRKMFGKLVRRRQGILESALIVLLEEACLYFPDIRNMTEDKIQEWMQTDKCLIDPPFQRQLLERMNKIYDEKKKQAAQAENWEWLLQAAKVFRQLEEWKKDPDKKDLFQYQKGLYEFEDAAGEKLLNFYLEMIQNDDRFWKRVIGFGLRDGSSGELAAVNLFAYITDLLYPLDEAEKQHTYFLMIDEIDVGLHPRWQQCILKYLTEFLEQSFPDCHFQLLVTSHSPVFLSDIPSDRVYLIRRTEEAEEGRVRIEACNNATFGANIYNLFYDGFFMDQGTIGTFAQKKIDAVIEWLQGDSEENFSEDEVDVMIEYIGEPVVRDRLKMMRKRKKLR